jgi:hypothetical protein
MLAERVEAIKASSSGPVLYLTWSDPRSSLMSQVTVNGEVPAAQVSSLCLAHGKPRFWMLAQASDSIYTLA